MSEQEIEKEKEEQEEKVEEESGASAKEKVSFSESGKLSVTAENIFPVIKQWLYTEKEIFIRELVSNAADAILKLQKLSGIG